MLSADRALVLAAVSLGPAFAAERASAVELSGPPRNPTDELSLTQAFVEEGVDSRRQARRRERVQHGKRPARVASSQSDRSASTLTDANLRNPQWLLPLGSRVARAFLGPMSDDGRRVWEQEDDCMHRAGHEAQQLCIETQDVDKLVLVGKTPVLQRSAERGGQR